MFLIMQTGIKDSTLLSQTINLKKGTEIIQGTLNMKRMRIARSSSTLYIWQLKSNNINFFIKYSIVTKVRGMPQLNYFSILSFGKKLIIRFTRGQSKPYTSHSCSILWQMYRNTNFSISMVIAKLNEIKDFILRVFVCDIIRPSNELPVESQ